ncbi:hypothetical protein LOTGIDRAFT_198238 [Lottia gigantea]|uniref:Uncharacterized protein n=1 Tax=Lottia gigantea TaxID=225164 RepID=V3ZMJ5_LOTGI|nr:hypothetical protein LOTGIDRAFT_198238 [Lottia gigantea]ESO82056.1 hypothetical protein LOTGIDRAFT_198238 [Lottia gigantea]
MIMLRYYLNTVNIKNHLLFINHSVKIFLISFFILYCFILRISLPSDCTR